MQASHRIDRGSRDYSVEVGGESLNGIHSLASARGASVEICLFRGIAVEGLDQRLARNSRFVDGAPAKIQHLFRMSQREACGPTCVPCVCARPRVSIGKSRGDVLEADVTRPTPVAYHLKLAIPLRD